MKRIVVKLAVASFFMGISSGFSGCSSSEETAPADDDVMVTSENEEALAVDDQAAEGAETDGDMAAPTDGVEEVGPESEIDESLATTEEAVGEESPEAVEPEAEAVASPASDEELTEDAAPVADDSAPAQAEAEVAGEPEAVPAPAVEPAPAEVLGPESTPVASAPEGGQESFTYKIRAGDSVSRIAEMIYGSAKQWRAIAQASNLKNPDLIFAGRTLSIPVLNDQARSYRDSRSSAARIGGDTMTVEVKAGDSLSKIAKDTLGNAGSWQKIFEQNRGAIRNPNLIRIGQKLTFVQTAH